MKSNIRLPERLTPRFHSVNEFDLVRELGSGAFAKVFQAFHRKTQQHFALKRIFLSKLCDSDRENIENELAIHSRLSHPNIVRFHDFFFEERVVNLVLDLWPRGNLYRHLRKNALTDPQIRKVFYQTMLGLQYLHGAGVLLRDLKPENILIDETLNISICDFGWASYAHDTAYCQSKAGTFAYMSPESLRGHSQTVKSDVWSLGILLYELIHGREPYDGDSCGAQYLKIQTQKLQFRNSIAEDAKNLIQAILRIDPRERPSLETIFESRFVQKHLLATGARREVDENLAPFSQRPTVTLGQSKSITPLLKSDTSLRPRRDDPMHVPRALKISSSPIPYFTTRFQTVKSVLVKSTTSLADSGSKNKGVQTTQSSLFRSEVAGRHPRHPFGKFLEKYATSKSPSPKELTRSMVEKVLTPSPNRSGVLTPKMSMSNLFKSPVTLSRRNVFLDFSRPAHSPLPTDRTDGLPKFNVKALLLKRTLAEKSRQEEAKVGSSGEKARAVPCLSPSPVSAVRPNVPLGLKKSFLGAPNDSRLPVNELIERVFIKKSSPISRKDVLGPAEAGAGTALPPVSRAAVPGNSTRSTNYTIVNPRKDGREARDTPKCNLYGGNSIENRFKKPVVSMLQLPGHPEATPAPETKVQRVLSFLDLQKPSLRFGKPLKMN